MGNWFKNHESEETTDNEGAPLLSAEILTWLPTHMFELSLPVPMICPHAQSLIILLIQGS